MFVAKDGGDKRFCSFWKDSEEEMHRVILRELPVRKSQVTAQKDLDLWAAERKLKEFPNGIKK